MILAHQEDPVADLRKASAAQPLRILISACIAGQPCGIDGSDYGMGGCIDSLTAIDAVQTFTFCPEDYALGTPRTMPDLHGGDGFEVLAGNAKVMDENGADLTAPMVRGAQAMLAFAKENRIELAILTDMSGACGSQVISDGCRLVEDRKYQVGVGVAAATLLQAGFHIVSQRDFRTLALIQASLDPSFHAEPGLVDHHQSDWYRETFPDGPPRSA
jgi:uncharacterized protein YbbK (DUF523 family)